MKQGGKRIMRRGNTALVLLITLLSTVLVLIGCSGGGGGGGAGGGAGSGTIASLKVGERVSVVDAQDSQAANQINSLKLASAVAALPADSPYNTDETHSYVEERSAESFDIINEILCMMAQTAYDEMLNEGNYKAMIDVGQCGGSKDDAGSQGQAAQNQSSGSNATEYEYWTVNSSRADDSSPQIVKVWIHEKAQDYGGGNIEPAKTINVKTIITESTSATNPYGIFTLYFAGIDDSSGQTMMTGYLKAERDAQSGEVLLKFYESGQHGQGSGSQQVTLNRTTDGSTGSGSISMTESWQGQTNSKDFNIAFNDNYFLRQEIKNDVPGDTLCMNRTNTSSSVWRYGVYNDENHASPGSRVTINSGFPIRYQDVGGTDYHGWAGYYGLWIPEEAAVSNGDTVYKQDYSSNGGTETAYTIFMARGKLRKHMKKTVTLGDITGVPISWNECSESGGNWQCIDSRVEWNGTNFVKNAVRSEDTNWTWQEVTEAPVTIDSTAWDFNFWSESLGGSGRINLMDPTDNTGQSQITLTDSTPVIFHVEDTVFPGDDVIPETLACFENCPDPANINAAEPFFAESTWQTQNNFSNINQNTAPANLVAGTNYIAYTFNTSTFELEQGGSPAVMTSNANSQYGIWTGAMFEPTTENFALLACNWDQTDSSTCSWQAWDQMDVFYTWESGTDQWNKLTALQLDGTFITFDPPVNVEYTHAANGAKYFLEYNGFGDLHGIPGKCVDEDTGQDTECWDSTGDKFIRWVPEFSLPDGSAVTDAVSSLTYYVKGLDKEERMTKEALASTCTDAGLALVDYTLPDSSLYVAPDIGTEPTVDGAPAVIGGSVEE